MADDDQGYAKSKNPGVQGLFKAFKVTPEQAGQKQEDTDEETKKRRMQLAKAMLGMDG